MVLKRISNLFVGLEFWGVQQSCMRSADRHSRGDFWSWTDRTEARSAEVTGNPHGRNQGEKLASTQRSHNFRRVRTTGKWTFGAQRALLGSRHKDNGKASETHVDHFWRRLQRGPPMPDDAAIGWEHPCETLTDNGAHINEICAAAQLWSPATWSAKPVPANPSWEGNTWQGYNGVQSRPDHILLSLDLTAPPVTIDFRSSHTLRGTALASIDHAPLRLTMRCRSRIRKQREKPRRLDRAKLAAATMDLRRQRSGCSRTRAN